MARPLAEQALIDAREWTPSRAAKAREGEPAYPGAPVLLTSMRRGEEYGDVRVQDFGETVTGGRYKVCQFLPGVVECSPGDTPKVWPEIHQIVTTLDEAGDVFARYVEQAHAAGWSDTDAE